MANKVKVFRKDAYYHIMVRSVMHMGYFHPPIIMNDFLAQGNCQFVDGAEERFYAG